MVQKFSPHFSAVTKRHNSKVPRTVYLFYVVSIVSPLVTSNGLHRTKIHEVLSIKMTNLGHISNMERILSWNILLFIEVFRYLTSGDLKWLLIFAETNRFLHSDMINLYIRLISAYHCYLEISRLKAIFNKAVFLPLVTSNKIWPLLKYKASFSYYNTSTWQVLSVSRLPTERYCVYKVFGVWRLWPLITFDIHQIQ